MPGATPPLALWEGAAVGDVPAALMAASGAAAIGGAAGTGAGPDPDGSIASAWGAGTGAGAPPPGTIVSGFGDAPAPPAGRAPPVPGGALSVAGGSEVALPAPAGLGGGPGEFTPCKHACSQYMQCPHTMNQGRLE